MRGRPSTPAVLAILALSIAGCSRLKGGGSTGNAPDAEEPSSPSSPWASNGSDVTRYPDEIPFGPDAIVAHDKTPVRKSPGTGDILATLPGGTDVVKLSTHSGEDLVMFDDPMNRGHRLMGWVPEAALEETAPTPTPTPTAPIVDEDAEPPEPPSPNPSPSPPGGHHHHHPHGPPKQH
jgi:hypothetical protein